MGFKYPTGCCAVVIFWVSLCDPCRAAVPFVLMASGAELGESLCDQCFSEAPVPPAQTLVSYKVPQLRQVMKVILVKRKCVSMSHR